MGPGTYEGKEKMVYLPWMSLGTFSEISMKNGVIPQLRGIDLGKGKREAI